MGQNLAGGMDVTIPGQDQEVYSTNNSSEDIFEDITTTNDLDADQRRLLTKRSKKLNTILGEALDEKTFSGVVRGSVLQSKSSDTNVTASAPSEEVSPSEVSPNLKNFRRCLVSVL